MINQSNEWKRYLERISSVDKTLGKAAKTTWQMLLKKVPNITSPISYITDDQAVKFAWDQGEETIDKTIQFYSFQKYQSHDGASSTSDGNEKPEPISSKVFCYLQKLFT